jgi:hypothetical protein
MPNLLIWQYPYKLDYGICAFIVKYILASYFDFGPLGVTVFLLKRTAFDLPTLREVALFVLKIFSGVPMMLKTVAYVKLQLNS